MTPPDNFAIDPPAAEPDAACEPVGRNRPPRARQWKPGQSGNPRGRPKTAAHGLVRARLEVPGPDGRTPAERIADALIEKAERGDLRAIKQVLSEITRTNPQRRPADEPAVDPEGASTIALDWAALSRPDQDALSAIIGRTEWVVVDGKTYPGWAWASL